MIEFYVITDRYSVYVITDRYSEKPELSSNGRDYTDGRTIAVRNGKPMGIRYWTSSEMGHCNLCGRYEPLECNNDHTPFPRDLADWRNGERLEGEHYDIALNRLYNGGFALLDGILPETE